MDMIAKILNSNNTLERYNPYANCPKCGGTLSTQYVRNLMRRECMRCGHVFSQLPLDVARGGAE